MLLIKRRKRKSRSPAGLAIYLVSDTHLHSEATSTDFPNLSNPPMYFYTGYQKLRKFVDAVISDRPQAVVHLGDLVHSSSPNDSYDFFAEQWGRINTHIPKLITPGNHDCSSVRFNNGMGFSVHDYLALKLGYESEELIAGSKFNKSVSITKGRISVRIIMVDTNIFPGLGHSTASPGHISSDIRQWVEDEIRNATEQHILIFAHKGRTYLDNDERSAFDLMVQSSLSDKPDVKVTYVYGHSHVDVIRRYDSGIPNYTIYNVPALIDLNPGKYYKIYVTENNNVTFELASVAWIPN